MEFDLDNVSEIQEQKASQIFGTEELGILNNLKSIQQAHPISSTFQTNIKQIDITPMTSTFGSSILKQIDLYQKDISYQTELYDVYISQELSKLIQNRIQQVKETVFPIKFIISFNKNQGLSTIQKKYVLDFNSPSAKLNSKTKTKIKKKKQLQSKLQTQYESKKKLTINRKSLVTERKISRKKIPSSMNVLNKKLLNSMSSERQNKNLITISQSPRSINRITNKKILSQNCSF